MATLEQLRNQLRILEADAETDAELTQLLEASRDHLESMDVDMSEPLAPAVSQAALILAAYWYDNGGAQLSDPTAPSVDRLIAPYRSVSL